MVSGVEGRHAKQRAFLSGSERGERGRGRRAVNKDPGRKGLDPLPGCRESALSILQGYACAKTLVSREGDRRNGIDYAPTVTSAGYTFGGRDERHSVVLLGSTISASDILLRSPATETSKICTAQANDAVRRQLFASTQPSLRWQRACRNEPRFGV